MHGKVEIIKQDKKSRTGRRKLNYFGHEDDGRCTLMMQHTKLPSFYYIKEPPLAYKQPPESSKSNLDEKLRVRCPANLDRFMVAPERKNVWLGGIRTQCEGVLAAKAYKPELDRGVYTVIPEVEGSEVTVDAIYKMWLALECAMLRRESLIIVEDPALAQTTKDRTEHWRLMNRFVNLGSFVTIVCATFFRRFPPLYLLPFTVSTYGFLVLRAMSFKDPASQYSECAANKQFESDPDSHVLCDAQISMRYLRAPTYRMFKLEDGEARDSGNQTHYYFSLVWGVGTLLRNIYDLDQGHHIIRQGYDPVQSFSAEPLNIFTQLRRRFLTFGNHAEAGRLDTVHWLIQNVLFYYFFLRHIPWFIQCGLEYLEREHRMAASIRYLQFRNLMGEERYEFPARNLYRTMQKDFPNNRVLKELYDHYNNPPEGYYESDEFLKTREPEYVTLKEALRRWKIAYYRNW